MALTNQDLNKIKLIVKEEIGALPTDVESLKTGLGNVAGELIDLKGTAAELRESIKLLPTRNEFLDSMSELMGEVKDERDENVIIEGRTFDHEKRIEKLEEIHPHGQHHVA